MAAPITLLANFHSYVTCKDCIVVSENNDLAICTDDGFFILEHRYGTSLTDTNHHFTKFFIPCSDLINIPNVTITTKEAQQLLPTDEVQSAILDRTVIPASVSHSSHKAFCCATWSPRDAGIHRRCILAGLSYDHRLSVYISNERNDYKQLAELSAEYYKYYYQNNEDKLDTNSLTLNQLKEKSYCVAATVICWSSVIEDTASRFSLLAVGMKNGDIVFWKATHPITSIECFSIYQVISTNVLQPTTFSWQHTDSNTVLLGVGFNIGIIKVITINFSNLSEPETQQYSVYYDSDLVSVSCLTWKTISNDKLMLISSKGEFVLAQIIQLQDNKIELLETAYSQGNHTLEAVALSWRNESLVLSSADGSSSLVGIYYDENSIRMEYTPIVGIKHKYNTKWRCHGGCLTTNSVFYISVYSPSIFYDHLKNKFPLAVHIVPLLNLQPTELSALVSNNKVDIYKGGDVFDIVRRNLHLNVRSPEATFKQYKSLYRDSLYKHQIQLLQAWRYMLIIIQGIALEKKDEEFDMSEMPEKAEVEKEVERITRVIILHHIQKTYDKSQTIQLTDNDIPVLRMMLKWTEVNKAECVSLITGLKTLLQKQPVLTELYKCVICQENYSFLSTAVECSNNHKFGLCCKTLLPCSELPFITCLTCDVTTLSIHRLLEYECLPNDVMRCSLCSTPLT